MQRTRQVTKQMSLVDQFSKEMEKGHAYPHDFWSCWVGKVDGEKWIHLIEVPETNELIVKSSTVTKQSQVQNQGPV